MSKCWLSPRDKLSSPDYMVSHWLLYYAYRVVFIHLALFMDRFLKRFLKRAAPSSSPDVAPSAKRPAPVAKPGYVTAFILTY